MSVNPAPMIWRPWRSGTDDTWQLDFCSPESQWLPVRNGENRIGRQRGDLARKE
jgi:hypothetical protein